jgi:hypothetical protein
VLDTADGQPGIANSQDDQALEQSKSATVAVLLSNRIRITKEPPTVNAGKTPPSDPLTPRERRAMMWVLAGVLVFLVAASTAVWSMTARPSSSVPSGETCVTVSVASSMGGGVEHACGAGARDWCRAAYVQRDAHAEAVQAACRAAGILPTSTAPST